MKSNSLKQHAKEYLHEYHDKNDTPKWLRLLIKKVIDTNGEVSAYDKEQIFEELLLENDCVYGRSENRSNHIKDDSTSKETYHDEKLTIKKITHKIGVNALIPEQSIVFSPICTAIYGLNGTGKSGYFRIMHELAGGEKSSTIQGNIYREDEENKLDVEIDYLLDDTHQKTYQWKNKTERNIYPFNQIKFFDSDYLPIFLNERENKINVEPFGLSLFQITANIIDELKRNLVTLKNNAVLEKPDLTPLIELIHSPILRNILQKEDLTEGEKGALSSYTIFTPENVVTLSDMQKKMINFQEENNEDRKKVILQEKKEIDSLCNHLINIKNKIESANKKSSEAIKNYLSKKKINDERRDQLDVLKNIPGQNTAEWLNFIESGHSYKNIIPSHGHTEHGTCLYCQQTLSQEALLLTKTYSQFLNDQSQKDYKEAKNKLINLKTELENLSIEYIKSPELTAILTNLTLKDTPLTSIIDSCISTAINQKNLLQLAMLEKNNIEEIYLLDLQEADIFLESLSSQREKNIEKIDLAIKNKMQNLKEIESKINELEDKKNISHWSKNIKSYFTLNIEINKISTSDKKINTSWVTKLSADAHEALLTEKLRDSFENELKFLGLNIEVKLEKVKGEKTKVKNRLTILKKDIREILSKGEQKAAALALFLAEVSNQEGLSPLVFDDPVDSLDHEYADSLAKRLLMASLNRQIIIFTHNKLFYQSILHWAAKLDDNKIKTHHICKNYTENGCNGKGHHVLTYKIDRESKDRTGKVLQTQLENCEYYIEESEKELKKSNYTISTVAHNLKRAIEHYIDDKILLNQGLLKDRNKSENIDWARIKKINVHEPIIDKLKIHWDNLSSRGTHLTNASNENPLKMEDFREIIKFIKEN